VDALKPFQILTREKRKEGKAEKKGKGKKEEKNKGPF
jgi:hypothetical protein